MFHVRETGYKSIMLIICYVDFHCVEEHVERPCWWQWEHFPEQAFNVKLESLDAKYFSLHLLACFSSRSFSIVVCWWDFKLLEARILSGVYNFFGHQDIIFLLGCITKMKIEDLALMLSRGSKSWCLLCSCCLLSLNCWFRT